MTPARDFTEADLDAFASDDGPSLPGHDSRDSPRPGFVPASRVRESGGSKLNPRSKR